MQLRPRERREHQGRRLTHSEIAEVLELAQLRRQRRQRVVAELRRAVSADRQRHAKAAHHQDHESAQLTNLTGDCDDLILVQLAARSTWSSRAQQQQLTQRCVSALKREISRGIATRRLHST